MNKIKRKRLNCVKINFCRCTHIESEHYHNEINNLKTCRYCKCISFNFAGIHRIGENDLAAKGLDITSINGRKRIRKRFLLFRRDGPFCINCGDENVVELTEDHIIPVSEGGSSELDNIQLLCRKCNVAKGAKIYNPFEIFDGCGV